MIHVIPHHILRGSWPPWYKLFHFNENVNIIDTYDTSEIELGSNKVSFDKLLENIIIENSIKSGDSVICDKHYFSNDNIEIKIVNLAKKYKCKFFIIDDDNQQKYVDTPHFTYFSNRFNIKDSKYNFNYFRYRTPYHNWVNNLDELLNPFLYNIRQKKFNFIVGVDKVERLISLKHLYDNEINSDGYIGYSAFVKSYSDNQLSSKEIEFRDLHLPIILDTPYERSLEGNVNVEFPPLPITLNSYISCICETAILDLDELHLSEKSWNPFISHNIPLILGSKYINNYLKDLGFWLADDLFDLKPQENKNDILNQFKSNLNIIKSLNYDELHRYFINNIYNIKNNFNILIKQKFIFDRNNYK